MYVLTQHVTASLVAVEPLVLPPNLIAPATVAGEEDARIPLGAIVVTANPISADDAVRFTGYLVGLIVACALTCGFPYRCCGCGSCARPVVASPM